ncbi:hypothetical protein DAPPUDRAFT_241924 [Daphnia pulex]|uniref:Uncharacterized protein n=1 Tax=Daphnia pulex TaxID=6669 RepID=E9GFE4_DAPPU|nr:hypothetical protein DAPPUDRAFT_241924 [Daphnia pulex]|eukprot:EFX81627.1 hypothetical protein DAPPUDRAFT_241924 [Daphnia pulex]
MKSHVEEKELSDSQQATLPCLGNSFATYHGLHLLVMLLFKRMLSFKTEKLYSK